jgi:hypothetical protein
MGTNMIYSVDIKDKPVAMKTLFDCTPPALPMIAIAVGSQVLYFKDFAPH